MKYYIYISLIIGLLFATSCGYDNFDEPKSTLSGRIVYNGNPVGVRVNGLQLELYQDGFALKSPIPVYISHDGRYSASLFNGTYKLVRKGGAPWEANLNDTLIVDVKNNTHFDVPVTPYFFISNESFEVNSEIFSANFTIDQIVETSNIAEVSVFLGRSILIDRNKNEQEVSLDLNTIKIGDVNEVSFPLSQNLLNEDYIFVRVGVRANVSNEFHYSQVQKIGLK